jgi:serine acetyltransferase
MNTNAFKQLEYLFYEIKRIVNYRWWRWITCWFGGSAGVILSYRIDRFFYLIFNDYWAILRIILFPIFLLLRILSCKHEIHYQADINMGMIILHPSLGIVISGKSIVGENLILTGGNCIGTRRSMKKGELIIGSNVNLGVNAVILGPLKLGDNIAVGAGAVVIDSFESNTALGGIPAKILRKL